MEGTPWNQIWQSGSAAELDWWKQPAPEVLELLRAYPPTPGARALDLGCGLGRHALAMAWSGYAVTAVDLAPAGLAYLAEWAAACGLPVRLARASYLDEFARPGAFDLVVSYNVIYHGSRAQFARAIANVSRALAPGGVFFFTCPSRQDGKYGFGEQVAAHTYCCERSLTPGDVHYFADEADLAELLAGLRLVSLKKAEGWWDNAGRPQFYSNWQVIVEK